MEEPLTHDSTVLKRSLAIRIYSTPGNQQLEHAHPARFRPSPLLSQPAMKRRAGGCDSTLLWVVGVHWWMLVARVSYLTSIHFRNSALHKMRKFCKNDVGA